MLHGIAWSVVQRMMIDAPSYDLSDNNGVEEIELTENNSEQILNYVNRLTKPCAVCKAFPMRLLKVAM